MMTRLTRAERIVKRWVVAVGQQCWGRHEGEGGEISLVVVVVDVEDEHVAWKRSCKSSDDAVVVDAEDEGY